MSGNREENFTASMNGFVKATTGAVLGFMVLFFFFFEGFGIALIAKGQSVGWVLLFAGFLFPLGSWIASRFAVKGYAIGNESVRINRSIGSMTIPMDEIEAVRLLSKKEMGILVNTGGSNGFFGFFGTFRARKIGHIRMYTTRSDAFVVMEMKHGYPIVLSPDDREGFIDTIQRHIQ